MSFFTQLLLKLQGASIGNHCRFQQRCRIGSGPFARVLGKLSIGSRFHADIGAIIYTYGGSISIADNVYVGPYSVIYGHGGVEIGSNTLIAMGCYIVSSNHTIPKRATLIRHQPDIPRPTSIGADCWLGAGVKVLGGVSIGDGCVVGAGSVVTKDLPAYSIAVGNPARVIRYRDMSNTKEI